MTYERRGDSAAIDAGLRALRTRSLALSVLRAVPLGVAQLGRPVPLNTEACCEDGICVGQLGRLISANKEHGDEDGIRAEALPDSLLTKSISFITEEYLPKKLRDKDYLQ